MDNSTDKRIRRIMHNLLPKTGLEGSFGRPQTLQERLAYYHTPGASVAVVNDFEVEWSRGFGVCNSRSRKRVTNKTIFQCGSISKPIFALAVMRLVQDGVVNLDEDIHRYLSVWRVPSNEGWQPRITLRQLLSHTSGLTVHGFPGYQASEALPSVMQVLNGEHPANTEKVEVNILPGLKTRYSGGGTVVAQQVLVDILKKPFPQIMHELVLEPFGMNDSTYEQPLPGRWLKNAATAHPYKGIPLRGKYHTYPEMAAAGLWSTATDLATAGVHLLKILHNKKAQSSLSKKTIESMLQPQLDNQQISEEHYIGLGFFCDGKGDSFYFGHGGSNEGFVAQMRFYKNPGKGMVVILNSNEGYWLMDEIIESIAREYKWPDALPKKRGIIRLENINNYVGIYTTNAGIHFRVDSAGDSLAIQYGHQAPLNFIPATETEFFSKSVNTTIRFEKNDHAQVVSLIISQEGTQIQAHRQTVI